MMHNVPDHAMLKRAGEKAGKRKEGLNRSLEAYYT
jgi:hypothetical protein